MDSKITFFLDIQEWCQLLNELEFLLQQCYGKDFKQGNLQMHTQVPHVVAFILSVTQSDMDSTLEAAKLIREKE